MFQWDAPDYFYLFILLPMMGLAYGLLQFGSIVRVAVLAHRLVSSTRTRQLILKSPEVCGLTPWVYGFDFRIGQSQNGNRTRNGQAEVWTWSLRLMSPKACWRKTCTQPT